MTETDFLLKSYEYELPSELIAQQPPRQRDASRLMLLDRRTGETGLFSIRDLPELLPPGLLVINNTKVIPARVKGTRASGGKFEFLLLTPLPLIIAGQDAAGSSAQVEGLLRSSKRIKIGEKLELGPDFSLALEERGTYGRCRVRLFWQGDLSSRFEELGALPLPPYIRRPADAEDVRRYQTLFAREDKKGSVAAPTAGLHFTPELRAALRKAGHKFAEVTLYVGYGTFSPVRCEDIREHELHSEYVEISFDAAAAITEAKAQGLPLTAIGTTVARTLEGIHDELGEIRAHAGWINIFLYPGSRFKVIDHLLTNFHLPGSSLLMLASAFAGREKVLKAYERAIAEKFRFFSYGDAMLIR